MKAHLALGGFFCIGLLACDGEPPEGPRVGPDSSGPVIESFGCTPGKGRAPLQTTCTFSVSHPTGAAVTCLLDTNGDGQAEYTLAVCDRSSFQVHRFEQPGTHPVKLTARDAVGESREASLTVEVEDGPPNQPPVIDRFTVTPPQGVVPLNVAFSWAISDPDGDRLTCLLDLNVDGQPEYTLPDCSSQSAQAHGFTTAGSYDVVLTVRDGRGGQAQRPTAVEALPFNAVDLRLARAEWGQSVVQTDPKLVREKPALFRAYVLADKPNTPAVAVQLQGSANGVSLGTLTMSGPSVFPTQETPGDLGQTFRAMVPEAWVVPGLVVTVKIDPENALAEVHENNNSVAVQPRIGSATLLHLTSVPVVASGQTGWVPQGFDRGLWRIWPLHSVVNQTRAPYTFAGSIGPTTGWSQLLQELAGLRQSDGSRRHYYGWVSANYAAGVWGIGYVGTAVATGRSDSGTTHIHELGHNFGRGHAPCGTAGDGAFPYAGAKIGTFGFDLISQTLISPTSHHDMMSYCDPTWVSDFSYNQVQAFLERYPPRAAVPPVPAQPLILVLGRITAHGAELRPVHRFVGTPTELPSAAEHSLRVTSAGAVVELPLPVMEVADLDEAESHFAVAIPDPGTLASIEVRHLGRTLGRKVARTQPSPVRPAQVREAGDRWLVQWDAQAFPSAMVAHQLGAQRTTLALFLEGGRAEVHTAGLPEGGFIDVSLSDGLNTARATLPRR